MKNNNCRFILSATNFEQFPHSNLMEIAFVGRSNVGKSSLINALVGSEVCRVSKTPGRTQQINFFDVNIKKHLMIADLPGYGYAVVSKQMRNNWNQLIVDYLQSRENLVRIFMLIDSRHGIKDSDEDVMFLLDKMGLSYQIILTKIDKIKSKKEQAEYEQVLIKTNETIHKHPACFPILIPTSSQKTSGLNELFKAISTL